MAVDEYLHFVLPVGVTMDVFIQAQEQFLEVAAEVAREQAGRGKRDPVKWVVTEVRQGSVELMTQPRSNRKDVQADILPRIVRSIAEGFRVLDVPASPCAPSFLRIALSKMLQVSPNSSRMNHHLRVSRTRMALQT
jgi:hypothetical protein